MLTLPLNLPSIAMMMMLLLKLKSERLTDWLLWKYWLKIATHRESAPKCRDGMESNPALPLILYRENQCLHLSRTTKTDVPPPPPLVPERTAPTVAVAQITSQAQLEHSSDCSETAWDQRSSQSTCFWGGFLYRGLTCFILCVCGSVCVRHPVHADPCGAERMLSWIMCCLFVYCLTAGPWWVKKKTCRLFPGDSACVTYSFLSPTLGWRVRTMDQEVLAPYHNIPYVLLVQLRGSASWCLYHLAYCDGTGSSNTDFHFMISIFVN